jgi:hypothetical protein
MANVLSALAIIILFTGIPSFHNLCRTATSLRCSCSAIVVGRSPDAANARSFSSSAGVQGWNNRSNSTFVIALSKLESAGF